MPPTAVTAGAEQPTSPPCWWRCCCTPTAMGSAPAARSSGAGVRRRWPGCLGRCCGCARRRGWCAWVWWCSTAPSYRRTPARSATATPQRSRRRCGGCWRRPRRWMRRRTRASASSGAYERLPSVAFTSTCAARCQEPPQWPRARTHDLCRLPSDSPNLCCPSRSSRSRGSSAATSPASTRGTQSTIEE